jgi:hypothetical protein
MTFFEWIHGLTVKGLGILFYGVVFFVMHVVLGHETCSVLIADFLSGTEFAGGKVVEPGQGTVIFFILNLFLAYGFLNVLVD